MTTPRQTSRGAWAQHTSWRLRRGRFGLVFVRRSASLARGRPIHESWRRVDGTAAARLLGIRAAASHRVEDEQAVDQPLRIDALGEEAGGAGLLDRMKVRRSWLHRQPENLDEGQLGAQTTSGF